MSANTVVIFDIDGTISDCAHREEYAKAKDWDGFHERCLDDPIIIAVADLLKTLSLHAEILLVTGRPEKYRQHTYEWLSKANLLAHVSGLLMRGNDDYRKASALKLELLSEHFGDEEAALKRVWLIVEDNDSVSEAYRNKGYTVLQSAVGGY